MISALTRAEVIKQWPTGGLFTLTDLWSGKTFSCKGSPPINYDHSDWMFATKADFDICRSICGRSWDARPAILSTPSGCVSAVSFHTVNHSIVVAAGAYEIVSPRITRATEKDSKGNWNPGHHMCMHYADTYKARSDSSYTRDMRAKVELAVTLGNNGSINVNSPTLSRDSANTAKVKEAQELLNKHGATLDADGGFGPLTEAAVKDFQSRYDLPVTGIVNEATWNALRGPVKVKEEPKVVYNKVEQIPEWARPTIKDLVVNKIITGINSAGHVIDGVTYGDLNIDDNLLRSITLNVRIAQSGLYNK